MMGHIARKPLRFLTRSDSNQSDQLQGLARILKLCIKQAKLFYCIESEKIKALISVACTFVVHIQKSLGCLWRDSYHN